MKRLFLFLTAFTGSVGVAFLLLLAMAWLATSVTPAHAQGVVERSRSKQSSEEEARQRALQASKTDAQSAARTFTVSQLFFQQLAELEAEGARLTKEAGGDAGKIDPIVPGAWLMSLECQVFQPTRWVYNQPHRFATVSPSATDFTEPAFAPGQSDAAEVRRQFLPVFGEPVLAMKFVSCLKVYAELIDGAARRLLSGGKMVGDRVVVRDASAVDDVVQESFIRAYDRLGSLSEPAHFPTWLGTIVRNEGVTWLRRHARRGQTLESVALVAPERFPRHE